jgi:hypothetical protein
MVPHITRVTGTSGAIENVEPDWRMDQHDLHVDGHDYAKPDRLERCSGDDRVKDRRGHQNDRRRGDEEASWLGSDGLTANL